MVVVVVLPFAQLLVKQVNVVGHAALVEELVELLVIDPV
jgi:phosphohistidine phosphatase SixA